MMKLNQQKYRKELNRFKAAVNDSVSKVAKEAQPKVVKAVAFRTLREIISNHRFPAVRDEKGRITELRDPVDTGRLRAGWGLAGKDVGYKAPVDIPSTTKPGDGRGEERKGKESYSLTLTNNVEYVRLIEFGTDKTPARTPVTRALATIEEAITEVKPVTEARAAVNSAFKKQGFKVYDR